MTCRVRLGLGHSLRWCRFSLYLLHPARNNAASEHFLFTFGRVQKRFSSKQIYFLGSCLPRSHEIRIPRFSLKLDACNQRFRCTESYNNEIYFEIKMAPATLCTSPPHVAGGQNPFFNFWTSLGPLQQQLVVAVVQYWLHLTLCNPMDYNTPASLSFTIFRV